MNERPHIFHTCGSTANQSIMSLHKHRENKKENKNTRLKSHPCCPADLQNLVMTSCTSVCLRMCNCEVLNHFWRTWPKLSSWLQAWQMSFDHLQDLTVSKWGWATWDETSWDDIFAHGSIRTAWLSNLTSRIALIYKSQYLSLVLHYANSVTDQIEKGEIIAQNSVQNCWFYVFRILENWFEENYINPVFLYATW